MGLGGDHDLQVGSDVTVPSAPKDLEMCDPDNLQGSWALLGWLYW